MSDVHSQLVALIARIDRQTAHDAICIGVQFPTCHECDCSRTQRIRAEIARRWEASVNAAIVGYVANVDEGMCSHEMSDTVEERWAVRNKEHWAAALCGAMEPERNQ